MPRIKKPAFRICTMVLILAAVPQGAWADDGGDSQSLPNVSVTAPKRVRADQFYTVDEMSSATGMKLSPKDTPQSVSVVARKAMDDRGLTSLEDAVKTATGINVYRQGYQTRYQSRGFDIAQISENGAHSTVCTMCGNNPHDQRQLMDMALYDRVEIVRGATGLMKGQSEPGGSINAILKKPASTPQTTFDVLADRWGRIRGSADVSGTLSAAHQVRGRAVAVAERTEGFRQHDKGYNGLLYGVVDKSFGEDGQTKITAGAYIQRTKDQPSLFGLPAAADGSDLRLPRSRYLGADWNKTSYRKFSAFTELEHRFNDDWKLSTTAVYTQNKSHTEYGYVPFRSNVSAAGTVSDGWLGRSDRYNHQWTFKADLEGKYPLFGRKHELYVGLNHSRERFNNLWRGSRLNGTYNILSWNGSELARPADWNNGTIKETRRTAITTKTATVATRLNITDRLHLLGGVGYTYWKENQYLSWMGTPHTVRRKGHAVPYGAITFDLTPNQSLYASYTSIFKYTGERYDIDGQALKPTQGRSYELGWKGAWNGGKLNSEVVLFQTDKENEPMDTWLARNPNGSVVPWNSRSSGAKAVYEPVRLQSRGIDLELSGSLNENWEASAGYTYNRRKYTATADRRANPAIRAGMDFSQHTPKHMLRLYTSYRLPFDGRKWTLGGGVTVQSKSSPITVGGQKQYLGGYAVWNASLHYQPNDSLKIGLLVNNLTDKRYYEGYGHRGTGQGHFYGEPRNVLFTLQWKMK